LHSRKTRIRAKREEQREKGLLIKIRSTQPGDLAIRRTQSVQLTIRIRSTQQGELKNQKYTSRIAHIKE
jgi:hypothetical protein